MSLRTYAQQKAALTRSIKAGRPAVEAECRRVVAEWESPEWFAAHRTNAWPDDWARWNRALQDVRSPLDLDSL